LQKSFPRLDKGAGLKAADIKVTIPDDIAKEQRQPMPSLPIAERAGNFREVDSGYTAETAIAEAKRCLNCAGHLCKDVCPYDTPRFTASGRIHIVKCDLCIDRLAGGRQPACITACPTEALDTGSMEALIAKYGEKRELEDFADYRETNPSVVFRAINAKK
jgi:ferredoxin